MSPEPEKRSDEQIEAAHAILDALLDAGHNGMQCDINAPLSVPVVAAVRALPVWAALAASRADADAMRLEVERLTDADLMTGPTLTEIRARIANLGLMTDGALSAKKRRAIGDLLLVAEKAERKLAAWKDSK